MCCLLRCTTFGHYILAFSYYLFYVHKRQFFLTPRLFLYPISILFAPPLHLPDNSTITYYYFATSDDNIIRLVRPPRARDPASSPRTRAGRTAGGRSPAPPSPACPSPCAPAAAPSPAAAAPPAAASPSRSALFRSCSLRLLLRRAASSSRRAPCQRRAAGLPRTSKASVTRRNGADEGTRSRGSRSSRRRRKHGSGQELDTKHGPL